MILKSKRSVKQAALLVAAVWAENRSKDPSTRVGACIIDPRTGGIFLGYNGFSAGVPDEQEWWDRRTDDTTLATNGSDGRLHSYELTKYDLVIHAEVNAVRKALMGGVDLPNATLVCTHLPCPDCMKNVVLANGIKQVVYGTAEYASQDQRKLWLTWELARLGDVDLSKMVE